MKHRKYLTGFMIVLAAAAVCFSFPVHVRAAGSGSMLSITGEARICPIGDGSGKYLLKSSGFYCLNEDGSLETKPAVHYFDQLEIGDTVLDGYYYHDESGKFVAATPHIVYLKNLTAPFPRREDQTHERDEEDSQVIVEAFGFEGYYMAGNLGRLSAAPQVRYIDNLQMNGKTFNGYYYFDEYGRMVTEKGIHYLNMVSNGVKFEGNYYFGGTDGVLVQENMVTEDGYVTDENGRLLDSEEEGIEGLKAGLKAMISSYQGEWSIYVKDLETQETISIQNQTLYSASLIKAFVMAKTYADMEEVCANEAKKMGVEEGNKAAAEKVQSLLQNMITVSDNESFNELVRLQTESLSFTDGARAVNVYLEEEGYRDTSVQHTLAPSASAAEGIGGRNTTSAEDCGLLLERIYNGECVSREASEEMLGLLLDQKVATKIPEGLPEDVAVAHKTGETSEDQHDIGIIYGDDVTYIMCILSENCNQDQAIYNIRDITEVSYKYLNLESFY